METPGFPLWNLDGASAGFDLREQIDPPRSGLWVDRAKAFSTCRRANYNTVVTPLSMTLRARKCWSEGAREGLRGLVAGPGGCTVAEPDSHRSEACRDKGRWVRPLLGAVRRSSGPVLARITECSDRPYRHLDGSTAVGDTPSRVIRLSDGHIRGRLDNRPRAAPRERPRVADGRDDEAWPRPLCCNSPTERSVRAFGHSPVVCAQVVQRFASSWSSLESPFCYVGATRI